MDEKHSSMTKKEGETEMTNKERHLREKNAKQ